MIFLVSPAQSDPEILCLVHFAGHFSALLLAPGLKNRGQDGARRGPRAVSVTRLTVLAINGRLLAGYSGQHSLSD